MNKSFVLHVSFIATLLFLVLFLVNTAQNGLRFTPDSHAYVELAMDWYRSYVLDKHHIWPPLYAAILSMAKGYNIKLCAHVLNGLSLCCTIWLWIALMGVHIRRKSLLWIYAILLASCMELHWIAQFLWSEGFFMLLLTLYCYAIQRYIEVKREWSLWLLGIFICGMLLPLQRHAGLFLLCGSTVAGLVLIRKNGRINLFKIHGFIVFIPWLFWAYLVHWIQDVASFHEDHYERMDSVMQFVWRLVKTTSAFGEVMLRAFTPSMLLPSHIEAGLGFCSLLLIWGFLWPWRFKVLFLRWVAFVIWAYMAIFLYIGYTYRIDVIRFYGAIWPLFVGLLIYRIDDWAYNKKVQSWLKKAPPYAVYIPYSLLIYTGVRLCYHIIQWRGFSFW